MEEKIAGNQELTLMQLANLVKDIEFERMELALSELNSFHALGIGHHELSHSNFLAWLLDPAEGHGLGPLVLRKLLRDIFADDRSDSRSLIDADLLDIRDVEIRREWKKIDIVIILPMM